MVNSQNSYDIFSYLFTCFCRVILLSICSLRICWEIMHSFIKVNERFFYKCFTNPTCDIIDYISIYKIKFNCKPTTTTITLN